MTNDVASAKKLWSKISRNQVVRTPTTTLINLSCGRIDQFAVRIERAEKSSLVWRHVGFNSLQRIGIDEKRCLHRAIVTPKAHGTPRCIIKAALIRKTRRHGVGRAPELLKLFEDQWPPSQLRKHGGIPLVRRSWWPRGDRREMTILRSVLRPSRSDILRAARFDRHLSVQMND